MNKFDEYKRKDFRVKCALCQRWMRYKPTEKTPATRREPPDAGTCTDCPIMKVGEDRIVRLYIENFN